MPRPHVPAELTDRPFTIAQAAQHGLTRGMLRSSCWRRVLHGVYVHASMPDSRRLRAQAVALVLDPTVFLCGLSAAWLYGVDLHPWREPVPSLWVGCHNRKRVASRPGWVVRELTVGPDDVRAVDGIPVTSPVRTGFDCGRWLPTPDAVVVIDALTHLGLTTVGAIAAYADAQFHVRHKRRVPRVLELVDSRSESPRESRLRLLMVMDGLRPLSQHEVWNGDQFVARLDFAFVAERVAVEYEGRQHAESAWRDEVRRTALERLGWLVVRVYAEDLRTAESRRALLARIRAALLSRR